MNTLIKLYNLSKYFYIKRPDSFKKEINKAVEKVNLEITEGEILGLVGESGCGKTTLGNLILNLYKPSEGNIYYKGKEVDYENKKNQYQLGVVFQDPFSSLNPKITIFDIIKEPVVEINKKIESNNLRNMIIEVLKKVGLSDEHLFRYPHEFSGGQRQRIAIARAMITNPNFILLDEPTSGLDVSIQAQILNLLIDLKKMYGSTYLFISHNIGVIKYMSNRIAVMYNGKIIEVSEKNELFNNPIHPYTIKLLSAVPNMDNTNYSYKKIKTKDIKDDQEMKNNDGCIYYNNCEFRSNQCRTGEPVKIVVGKNHIVYCNRNI